MQVFSKIIAISITLVALASCNYNLIVKSNNIVYNCQGFAILTSGTHMFFVESKDSLLTLNMIFDKAAEGCIELDNLSDDEIFAFKQIGKQVPIEREEFSPNDIHHYDTIFISYFRLKGYPLSATNSQNEIYRITDQFKYMGNTVYFNATLFYFFRFDYSRYYFYPTDYLVYKDYVRFLILN